MWQNCPIHGEIPCKCVKPVDPSGYIPETPFLCDGNLVYNLRQTAWKKGEPEMSNDIAVTIQARHLPAEIQTEIADVICTALNRKYVDRI